MAEPNLTDARIVELDAQPTAAIRVQQPMAELDLKSVFDQGLPRVMAAIQAAGQFPVGPPFGRYHRFGPDIVDVETGFPIESALPEMPPLADCASGEVGRSELPGGPTAMVVHLGAYETLGQAYDWLHEWIHSQGSDEGEAPWESYASDPSEATTPDDIRTEIFWPVATPASTG